MTAGTVTVSEERLHNIQKIIFSWTSGNGAESGTASDATSYAYTGQILRALTVPGAAGLAPDDNYDITLTDEAGVDVAIGLLANRDNANTEWVTSGMGAVVGDKLTINVTNAGDDNTGTLTVYVGMTPEEAASDTVAVQNALYGSEGITDWPIAAAPGDGASLAEAIRYVVESQIGTIYNTVGVPTLGGVLGDVGNVSIAERLEEIQAEIEEVEHHFHTRARWLGLHAAPSATDWADDTLSPFIATSGNNTWGGATDSDIARVLGKADTPILGGQTKFDMDSILVVASGHTTVYKVRFIYGDTDWASSLAAGQYTETMVLVLSAASKTAKENVRMPRLRAGQDQVWCQIWNATNDSTLSFFVGVHGYDE